MRNYFIYILTNPSDSVLYIGMTNDLKRRVYEHKQHFVQGFTQKYNIKKLVYFEQTTDVNTAISREKQLKNWRREKKLNLINLQNPTWQDLYQDL